MAVNLDHESETVDAASRSIAWVLVIVLTVIIAFVCILMAFSTRNTPMSVDGDGNTRSQWIESPSSE